MKQPHKHAEVLRAIADGKKVQHNAFMRSSDWYGASKHCNPISHPELEWRVKPEPKPDVVAEGILDCPLVGLYNNPEYGVEFRVNKHYEKPTVRFTFDGETGKLKKAEVLE